MSAFLTHVGSPCQIVGSGSRVVPTRHDMTLLMAIDGNDDDDDGDDDCSNGESDGPVRVLPSIIYLI